jgi:hypothetical protein
MRKYAWLLFVMGACGPGVSGSDKPDVFVIGGGADGGLTGQTCNPGTDQPTCDGSAYETCNSDGTWHVAASCNYPQVCAASVGGCAACDPAVGLGCDANGDSYNCDSSGNLTTIAMSCGGGGCVNGQCQGGSSCGEAGVKLIYVVDDANNMYSFDPSNGNKFTKINTLNCPAGAPLDPQDPGPAAPFSMGIDRSGTAWVLYSSGEIFNVSITTNNAPCAKSSPAWPVGNNGFQEFGMGFASDTAGSNTEKLYIAGGAYNAEKNGNMGWIDTTKTTLSATTLVAIPYPKTSTENSPELTGTGDGVLFGYYPGLNVTYVAELDKSTGMVANYAGGGPMTWDMPAIPDDGSGLTTVIGWAFAHYGGKLYAFVTTGDVDPILGLDPTTENSQVYVLDPSAPTNKGTLLLNATGKVIVGAGVSTCAPVTIN